MKTSTTAERLQQIMDERNLKQVDVLALAQPYCKKYGISLGKTALSQYMTGTKSQPIIQAISSPIVAYEYV